MTERNRREGEGLRRELVAIGVLYLALAILPVLIGFMLGP